jgi:hypothetical protein
VEGGSAEWGWACQHIFLGLAIDSGGDIVLAMANEASIDFCGTPLLGSAGALAIAKLDASGNCVWSSAIGGAGATNPRVADLALGSDDTMYIVGGYSQGTLDLGGGPFPASTNESFVAKRDAAGNHLWAVPLGSNTTANSVVVAATGHAIVAGT